jgi:hypothetical protein
LKNKKLPLEFIMHGMKCCSRGDLLSVTVSLLLSHPLLICPHPREIENGQVIIII